MRPLLIALVFVGTSNGDVVVHTLDGKAPLRGISLEADSDSVSIQSAKGAVDKVATARVIQIATVPLPAAPPAGSHPFEVLLTDGTRLRGVLEQGPHDFVRLNNQLLREMVGPLDIDLDQILSIRRVDTSGIRGASLIAPVRNDDVAYTLKGSRIKGTIKEFTAKSVVIARALGPRAVPYATLAAVFVDNQAMPALQGLHAVARLVDGSAIILKKNFRVLRGTLSGQTPSGLTIQVKTKHIAVLGFMGGAFVHLSNLKPKVSRKPFFPLPEGPAKAAMLEYVCPVRMDKSPDGRAITLDKRRYYKGIGVRPHTELTFDLAGKYRLFQALCGIDDEIFGPNYGRGAGAGSVVFSVYGDDKRLFQSPPVVGGKPPVKVRVDIGGVRTLRLVVGLVPKELMPKDRTDSPELDNAVWARPLLIR